MSNNNPRNGKKLITPNRDLIMPGQQKPKPKPLDPQAQIQHMIRAIRQAKDKGLATVASMLANYHVQGWPIGVDENLPANHVLITLRSHFWHDIKDGPQQAHEQQILLGMGYLDAVKVLKETLEQDAAEAKATGDGDAAGGEQQESAPAEETTAGDAPPDDKAA